MMKTTFLSVAIAVALLSSKQIRAEEAESATPATSASAPVGDDAILYRLDAAEKEIAALKNQNTNLSMQVADLQDSQGQASTDAASDLGKTRVFGFFDMSFGKLFPAHKDNAAFTALPITDKTTFMLTSLNVYLGNQITEKLKFLSELRFIGLVTDAFRPCTSPPRTAEPGTIRG
jgi:hypothetical protein